MKFFFEHGESKQGSAPRHGVRRISIFVDEKIGTPEGVELKEQKIYL